MQLDVYGVSGRGVSCRLHLRMRSPLAYRFHPDTIRDLHRLHQMCEQNTPPAADVLHSLLAKLVQDRFAAPATAG